ncbi:hypothetical protein NBT05_01520 [Aquimarina sp. ERC-38]|uniref:hypothetical protein n=1 Tax=Aquimarina sp. ERC-38 TaxID=2949996 RepID=UPI0022455974|nr:hypothetical protein [Aquimarina sp. ERC-38]UZO81166.1 hypothetical protein NBT05_01520 [Aquimarina sp. ERC-38]
MMYPLKKLIFVSLFLSVMLTYGQKRDDGVFFIKKDQISKFHTITDLQELKKGDLLKLYIDRFKEIATVLPYIAITHEADVRLSDVGIKEDSDHIKILKKSTDATTESLETISESIQDLVAYADTEKIIWTILFYEETIKKMRIGVQEGF